MIEMKPEDVMRALEEWIYNFNGTANQFCALCDALALLREYKVKIEVLEEAKNQLEIDICNATMNLEHAQTEIERLNKELDGQFGKWKMLADKTEEHYEALYQDAKQAVREEAITEFAELLMSKCDAPYWCVWLGDIEDYAKELKGEQE